MPISSAPAPRCGWREPALQSWIKPSAPPAVAKSRPLWLLIGLLWLSTALVTAGTVAAIATLVG